MPVPNRSRTRDVGTKRPILLEIRPMMAQSSAQSFDDPEWIFDRALFGKLTPYFTEKCPFTSKPKANAPVKWVEPRFVCEVAFQEWTTEGKMRAELMMNPELPQYSDAATYIELSEASFRLKSGKLSLKPAIVFGPPETADFNGEEHFDYVESFFRSLRGCDPNDVATILDSVIDEDDPHRSWWNILSKKVDDSFVARQLVGNEN